MGVEIQEEDLLGFVNADQNPPKINNGLNGMNNNGMNNIQLGMVHTLFPLVDSVFSGLHSIATSTNPNPVYSGLYSATNSTSPNLVSMNDLGFIGLHSVANIANPALFSSDDLAFNGQHSPTNTPSPTSLRYWAKFFSQVDPGLPTVAIPAAWMDFFTLLLLQQASFEWAGQFLQSPAWALINQQYSANSFSFSLPNSSPSVVLTDICCVDSSEPVPPEVVQEEVADAVLISSVVQEEIDGAAPSAHQEALLMKTPASTTIPATPKKGVKRGKATALSDSEVRCSNRLLALNKGFKPSTCKDRNCLGCATKPPLISSSVVRELCTTFCNVDPLELSDEKLHAKPASKKPMGRPKKNMTSKDKEDKLSDEKVHAKPASKKPVGCPKKNRTSKDKEDGGKGSSKGPQE